MKPLTIYLALPYTSDPKKSFELASHQMFQLRRLGFYPLSPINHTHNYHLEIKYHYCPKCLENTMYSLKEDWFCYYCAKCKNRFMEPSFLTDDYYDWYLHLLKGLMNYDTLCSQSAHCAKAHKDSHYSWIFENRVECDESECCGYDPSDDPKCGEFDGQKYDSGCIVFMSETACNLDGNTDCWYSKGCELEYKFAKENHILVIKTESFIKRAQHLRSKVIYEGWEMINLIIKNFPEVVLS